MPDKSQAPDPKTVKLSGKVEKAQKAMLKSLDAVRKEIERQQGEDADAAKKRALERIEWRLSQADALSDKIETNVKDVQSGSDVDVSDLIKEFNGIIRTLDKNTRSIMKEAKVLDGERPAATRQIKKLGKLADSHGKSLDALQNHLKQSQ